MTGEKFNRRDKIEAPCVALLEQLGGKWFQARKPFPCDGWILFHRLWFPVEFKSGGLKLTPNEIKMEQQVEAEGGVYLVVRSVDQFFRVLEVLRGDAAGKIDPPLATLISKIGELI